MNKDVKTLSVGVEGCSPGDWGMYFVCVVTAV